MERTGKAVESSKMYDAREKHTNLYLLNMNICEVIIVCCGTETLKLGIKQVDQGSNFYSEEMTKLKLALCPEV